MGAFKDLFKSRHETKHSPAQLPQPLWALATEPRPCKTRPAGPRSPSKRSDVSSVNSSSSRAEAEAEARARALAGRQAGERAREGLMHKRRRRSESLRELSQELERVQLESSALPSGRKPLPSTPAHVRPIGHGRTHSTPAAILTRQDMLGASPTRPRPPHSHSHQPTSPPKGRPTSELSTSPTRNSLYAQALPSLSRPPQPPVPRGPNPIRQAAPPSAPSSAPQSRNVSGASSCFSPMFPGSFPKEVGVGVGLRMTEPWGPEEGSPSANSVSTLPYMYQPTPTQPSPLYQQHQQSLYNYPHAHNSAPPPPVHPRPRPRPISSSASAPLLSTSSSAATPTKPKRKPAQIIDLSHEPLPSTPPRTPTALKYQCCGTTGTGKRCTRSVAGGTPVSSPSKAARSSAGLEQLEEMLEADGDVEGVVRFCFQHAKQALGERGCFVTPREGRGKWIEFEGESARPESMFSC